MTGRLTYRLCEDLNLPGLLHLWEMDTIWDDTGLESWYHEM